MRPWGQATDLMLLSLKALGRATHWTVADDAELPPEIVRKSLHRMAHVPLAKRRVHIAEWTLHADDRRNYWRPVYAFGPGPNKAKPAPLGHAEASRRWVQRCQLLASQMVGMPGAHVPKRAARRAGVLL